MLRNNADAHISSLEYLCGNWVFYKTFYSYFQPEKMFIKYNL